MYSEFIKDKIKGIRTYPYGKQSLYKYRELEKRNKKMGNTKQAENKNNMTVRSNFKYKLIKLSNQKTQQLYAFKKKHNYMLSTRE